MFKSRHPDQTESGRILRSDSFQSLFVCFPAAYPVASVFLLLMYPILTGFTIFCVVGIQDESRPTYCAPLRAVPVANLRFQRLSSGKTVQRNHLQQTEKVTICGQAQVSPSSSARQCCSPRKGFLPHSCGMFRCWYSHPASGQLVPKSNSSHGVQNGGHSVLPLPGYSFSNVYSVLRSLSIDELSQVYTFLTACAVYP